MADAWEDKIAAAVVTELNDASRSWNTLFDNESCVAVRTRKPWYELADLATLQCSVVPATIERTRLSRAARKFDYGILVDLQRVVDPTDDTTLKALSYAAETIHDWFDDGHELAGLTGWICLEAQRRDVYSLPQLYEERTWETLIALAVRGHRA